MHFSGFICWVYAHETLTAGFLAVVAAFISVFFLNKQIKQQQTFRETDRKARLYAAKAVLPLFLSQINEYGMNCLQLTKKMCEGREFENRIQMPVLPHLYMTELKECIEFADEDNRKRLVELMQNYQVQNERLRDWVDEYRPEVCHESQRHEFADKRAINKHGAMFSVIELLLSIQELWSFARSDTYVELEMSERNWPPEGSRIERAKFLLLHSQRSEYAVWVGEINNWPEFIAHYERSLDIRGDTR